MARWKVVIGLVCCLCLLTCMVAMASESPATAPRSCPPLGICLPVSDAKAIDGDTLEVTTALKVRVRILDCWSKERWTPEGSEATKQGAKILLEHRANRVFLPMDAGHPDELWKMMTLARCLGDLYFDDGQAYSALMIAGGWATAKKDP